MDRREFLGRTAGALAAMSVSISRPGETRAVPPPDQINLGVIGVGSRGKEVMRMMLRSEEHTSELQSLAYLVCRLLLEKKKKKNKFILYGRNVKNKKIINIHTQTIRRQQ